MGTTKDIREAVEAELEFDPLVDAAKHFADRWAAYPTLKPITR